MKNEDLIEVLDQLCEKMAETTLLGNSQHRLLSTVTELKAQFAVLEVPKQFAEVYRSLVAKGQKLLTYYRVDADSKELQSKTKYYVGYLNAAYGDFTGQVKNIQPFYRVFLLCSILFMVLSPMYLTPIFSIIFIIPIALAIKGIKLRSKTGYLLALLIAPVSIMTSVMWIRNGIYVLGNFQQAVARTMADSGMSEGVSTALTIGCPILGSILMVLAIVLILQGYKVRKLFV
jgi:hypothetical protein